MARYRAADDRRRLVAPTKQESKGDRLKTPNRMASLNRQVTMPPKCYSDQDRFLSTVVLWFCLAVAVGAATITVTNTGDSGPGSLREALLQANALPGPDRIEFAVQGTVLLQSPLPMITDDVTIVGSESSRLRISGGQAVPLLVVSAQVSVAIQRLTLADGLV